MIVEIVYVEIGKDFHVEVEMKKMGWHKEYFTYLTMQFKLTNKRNLKDP